MAEAFRGIYPMQYAFFTQNGGLDRSAMRQQFEACIAAGVDGISILGLATEVNKLSLVERHQVLEWAAEDIAQRVPLSVTVAEASVEAQTAFAQAAARAGASWIVLQPPPVRGLSEAEYIRFFGRVADAVDLPIGIQNAPEYISTSLSPSGIATLARNHGNFRILKGEGPVLSIRQMIEETQGELAVFNGRGGLELTDNIRAGCAGMVPGAESCDLQKQIFDLIVSPAAADQDKADQRYSELLPLLVFLMQSLENLLCYGKRLAAARMGIDTVTPRCPSMMPTEFGLGCLRNMAGKLWPDLDLDLIR